MLYQNYPNPFNPMTVSNYRLSASGLVVLQIYNVLGKEVRTLVNEHQNAYNYSVTLDGSNIPSGVYFCRIQAGDNFQSEKVVLSK